MKETVLFKHQIDTNYLSNLPVDVLSVTFIWTNDEKLNLYRTFTSTLNEDNEDTEERQWTLSDSSVISENEMITFIHKELEHTTSPAFVVVYRSGDSELFNIRGD